MKRTHVHRDHAAVTRAIDLGAIQKRNRWLYGTLFAALLLLAFAQSALAAGADETPVCARLSNGCIRTRITKPRGGRSQE